MGRRWIWWKRERGAAEGRRCRGFNLIEVLAVSVIISILATVALANLREARIQANEISAVGALNQLQNAYEQYRVTNRRVYPQYLSTGQVVPEAFPYASGQQLFQDLVNQGFLPQRYSGQPYSERDLLAPGYQLIIFPYDRPGLNLGAADISQNYALALQPYTESKQRFTLAVLNGNAEGGGEYTGRFYKLPDRSLVLTSASLYAQADRG